MTSKNLLAFRLMVLIAGKRFFLFVIFLFALDNPVSATLPSNQLWREGLTNNVIGFGKNTTGGKRGTLYQVTNLNDSGAGSLRAGAEAVGPMWITFTVSGTITLQSVIHIKSDKTIDGRGQNIVIANNGLTIGTWTDLDTGPVSNVIIENISMKNNHSNGMIIIAENASNVWIDHNTFQNAIDEILYVGSGSGFHRPPPSGVTISWNFFLATTPGQGWGDKSILVSDPSGTADVATTITLHHNHYQTYVRHPLARYAKIHAFNNYYDKTIVGVDAVTDVQFYSENEIFERNNSGNVSLVKVWVGGTPGGDPRGALNAKVVNPWLINGATVEQINPSTIFVPSSYYSYTPDTANAVLQTAIINNAGWQTVQTQLATYYVSPTGNNTDPGTISRPFATLQKAHDVANPGDTIYMRGGTYHFTAQVWIDRSGSSGNYINVFNYPGELPIVDGSSLPSDGTNGYASDITLRENTGWWHFKGLEVSYAPAHGFILVGSSNNIIEQCVTHHNTRLQLSGGGIMLDGGSSNNLILDNDSHHNGVYGSSGGGWNRGNRSSGFRKHCAWKSRLAKQRRWH